MRSLQRIRHQKAPDSKSIGRIQQAERGAIARKRERLGLRRILRVMVMLALGYGAWRGYASYLKSSTIAEGLARADTVEVRSPSRVRVTEVLVRPGELVERGAPLVRLELLDDSELRVAESLVAQARARVELARAGAGGELGPARLGTLGDRLEEAELEVELAREQLDLARARATALEAQQASLVLDAREEQLALGAAAQVLDQSLAEGRARVEDRRAELGLAELDADNARRLRAAGLVSAYELEVAGLRVERRAAELEDAEEGLAGLAARVETDERLRAVNRRRAEASEERMAADLATARREVRAAERRLELLGEQRERRAELLPGEAPSGADLRAMEVGLLQSELDVAEARLAALHERLAPPVVRAEMDGVLDRVDVSRGSIVEADGLLVTYFDPASMHVLAYVPVQHEAQVEASAVCDVVLYGRPDPLMGFVRTIGASYVEAPDELSEFDERGRRGFLPVIIEVKDADGVLRPNRRLRVHFEPESGERGQVLARERRPATEDPATEG